MNPLTHSFDRLATVEKSFQVAGPWRGGFELGGHHVRCALDSGEWVRLSVPLAGSEKDLVRQQGSLLLPIKIVAGPALIAEMPLTEELASTFAILRAALRQGLSLLASGEKESPSDEKGDTEVNARFLSALEESAFTWDRDNAHLSTRVGTARVVAMAIGVSVVFQTTVIHVDPATGPSLDALTHFVLALNARFRLVRGSFVSGRLVQEVALPVAVLTPVLVNRAVGAISDSFRMTKRAFAALVDTQMAEQYLEFHKQGRHIYADTHH